ncbi:endonuclease domain-containing protein [Nonomuraea maritima]|uniref:endonuclease domain-containing protein n=1 Tax=Nonomuraea maritima TaxID=683260 RepID=UPI003720C55D
MMSSGERIERTCEGPECENGGRKYLIQDGQSVTLCRRHANQLRDGKPLRPLRKVDPGRPCIVGREIALELAPCSRESSSRGLCRSHAQQQRAGRPLGPLDAKRLQECSYSDCTRPTHTAGLCQSHYAQKRRGQELGPLKLVSVTRICSYPDCGRPHDAHGLCDAHNYQRRKGQELRPIGMKDEPKLCSQPGCLKLVAAKTLCRAHYNQQYRGQELKPIKVVGEFHPCGVEGCSERRHSYGYCSKHAMRYRNHGDPLFSSYEQYVRPDGSVLCRLCERWKESDEYPVQRQSRRPDQRAGRVCRQCRVLQRHNLQWDQYERLLQEQGDSCAICMVTLDGRRDTQIDHDHSCCPGSSSCGKCVRGLLCGNCNKALGLMRDNVTALMRAVEYLQRSSGQRRE